ncbi:MAG: hypothetical protein AB7F50_09775 [Fimbriimonadaceae bacterium]
MPNFRSVPLLFVLVVVGGCQPVTRPGVQVQDTRSVLLETVSERLPDGATLKTTYPHGSRNTRYAAVLIVGDYTTTVADDEEPGSEQLLASWAEEFGNEKILTMRVTDDAPTAAARRARVLAAWEMLGKAKLVDRTRRAILVQGDASYTVAPLLRELSPQAVVFANCPARPFRVVARERALRALAASDGALPQETVLAGVEEWERGRLPGGPFWSATFGGVPQGYYDGSFDWKLPDSPRGLPVFVLTGESEREGSDSDEQVFVGAYGAEAVQVPLTDRNLKPRDDRNSPGPTDPIVPDAFDAALQFLVPILSPSDLREG